MSRGLGILQCHVCEVLYAAEGHELPLRELRHRLGEPDRSNLRRSIRGLLKRGIVEEYRSREARCVKLTFWGALRQHPLPNGPPRRPRVSIRTKLREEIRALREAREEEQRRLEAEEPRWIGYKHRFVRRRFPGPTQTRILSVLWEYADPLDEGLPVTAVKAIVGGNRSNTRRAIRTLLLRGQVDESEDGERIRLAEFSAHWFVFFSPVPIEPIIDEHAREILKKQQGVNFTRRS